MHRWLEGEVQCLCENLPMVDAQLGLLLEFPLLPRPRWFELDPLAF